MSRISFKRILIPASVMLISIGISLLFTYKYLESVSINGTSSELSFSACNALNTETIEKIRSQIIQTSPGFATDSGLIQYYYRLIELSADINKVKGCPYADTMAQHVNRMQLTLEGLFLSKLFEDPFFSIRNSYSKFLTLKDTSAYPYSEFLKILRSKDWYGHSVDTAIHNSILLGAIWVPDSAQVYPPGRFLMLYALEFNQFQQRLLQSVTELYAFREKEAIRRSAAVSEYQAFLDQKREKIFIYSIISWIVSIFLLGGYYFFTAVRRLWPAMKFASDTAGLKSDQLNSKGLSVVTPAHSVSEGKEVISVIDLSRIFFECGGDVQRMRSRLNAYMTSVFASASNMKIYAGNGNGPGLERMLPGLIRIHEEFGMEERVMQLRKLLILISSVDQGERADAMTETRKIADQMLNDVSVLRDQVKNSDLY